MSLPPLSLHRLPILPCAWLNLGHLPLPLQMPCPSPSHPPLPLPIPPHLLEHLLPAEARRVAGSLNSSSTPARDR
ncbi:hypothetical protein DL93DRAFT_2088074 [Clavulina sp. PMI_390]|nr:hypothetical protein DL93DRAFT_2088074 [Clavulina sp. PMI_390]